MAKKRDIIWLNMTDSTNDELRRRISELDNLSVLSAMSQTTGRGQRGNSWSSAPGENLTFSILLKFPQNRDISIGLSPLLAREQFILTEIASLSVVSFLSGYGINARIKWPNDIYVDDKKICGILVENILHSDYISASIIGIGLNINQRNFNVNIPNPTSVLLCNEGNDESPKCYDIKACLDAFMDIFSSMTEEYLEQNTRVSRARLRAEYLKHLWRINEYSRFIDYTFLPSGHLDGAVTIDTQPEEIPENHEFTGSIRGINDIGLLLIENEKGELHEFAFKEICHIL